MPGVEATVPAALLFFGHWGHGCGCRRGGLCRAQGSCLSGARGLLWPSLVPRFAWTPFLREIKCDVCGMLFYALLLGGAVVLFCFDLPRRQYTQSEFHDLSYFGAVCFLPPLANHCLYSNNCLPSPFQAVFCPPTHPPTGGGLLGRDGVRGGGIWGGLHDGCL